MSRNFALNDKISLGDISAAHFLDNTAWSTVGFIRVENLSNNHILIAKYDGVGNRQMRFFVRTTGSARFRHNEDSVSPDTASSIISVGVWYLLAATADSSGNCNTYVFDNTSLVGSASDTLAGDSASLTAPITLGEEENGGSDHVGDLAHIAYFDIELSQVQIESYRNNPELFVTQYRSNVVFYLPLGGFSSPEFDWSGNENSGTISVGTTRGDNPPVALRLPGVSFLPDIDAGATMNQLQKNNLGADLFNGTLI